MDDRPAQELPAVATRYDWDKRARVGHGTATAAAVRYGSAHEPPGSAWPGTAGPSARARAVREETPNLR